MVAGMISSSLPRIVTTQIQCAFGTYFWEMYTQEFGWSPAEYGTVSSLYNATQFISYIIIGLIFYRVEDTSSNTKLFLLLIEAVAAIIHASNGRYHRGLYNLLGVTCKSRPTVITNIGSIVDSTAPKVSAEPKTIASTFPSTFLNHAPKPPVQFTGCFNTPRMNAWKRFMGTRAFWVYRLVIIHGIAMSGYELCTQGVPQTVATFATLGNTFTVNMMFFTVANLFVIWLFSGVRYYVHGIARLANSFLFLGALYNILQLFLLIVFVLWAEVGITTSITLTSGNAFPYKLSQSYSVSGTTATKATADPTPSDSHKATGYQVDIYNVGPWVQIVCLTVFHATVFFWIFTGGPLTFYVSTNILGGHEKIKAFGVPTILIGFAGAQFIPGILSLSQSNNADQPRIGATTEAASNNNVTNAANTVAGNKAGINFRRGILGVSILGQFFTLLFFNPYDYWWNKSKWLNYLILVMTGVVNTLLLSITYLCLGLMIGTKKWRMAVYGIIYAVMGLNVSYFMGIMFRSFNADEIRRFCGFNYHYCFPTVYKAITILFWLLNIMAFFFAISWSLGYFGQGVGTGKQELADATGSDANVVIFAPGFTL